MSSDQAFETGYYGYSDGLYPDDNPYPRDTEQWLSWDEGWSQAQLEDEDAYATAEPGKP
jgi:hypothetical protein